MLFHSIDFIGHPTLGNLSLDFTDGNGDAFSTIILAGQNGSGKTRILDSIFELLSWNFSKNIGEVVAKIELSPTAHAELNALAQKLTGTAGIDRIITVHYAPSDANNDAWSYYHVVCDDISTKMRFELPENIFYQGEMQKILRAYFNEAAVNFNAQSPGSVTTLQLDKSDLKSTRSGQGDSSSIVQLLVDVRAADAEELLSWTLANPGIAPNPNNVQTRIARFADAFEHMFPTKRLSTVKRNGNHLDITFEEHGRETKINQLSTGEKQIVFRAGFLLKDIANAKTSVLLIDEPELSLHPEWQSKIVGFYQRLAGSPTQHAQLIMATHSPFIVHGAPNSKTIILEKDAKGTISVATSPAFPTAGRSAAIRAFNIEGFLRAKHYDLIVLVEGETDADILRTAWEALNPGAPCPYEFRAALGDRNINITLRDDQLFSKAPNTKIVGLFDFDGAYNQWKGVWSKGSSLVVASEADGITRKHPKEQGWAMLLPVPAHRAGYADSSLGGDSILSIEFLFEDADIPANCVQHRAGPLNAQIPYFLDAQKTPFAAHVATLPAKSFFAFTPIFDRLADITNGVI